MTVLNDRRHERSHRQQVSNMIATVSDTETVIEMQALASQYQRIRQSLLVAISEIDALDSEYESEHTDSLSDLRAVLRTMNAEELAMHEMITATFGDETETAGV